MKKSQIAFVSLLAFGLPLCAAMRGAIADEGSDRIVLADVRPLSGSEMQDIRAGFIDPTGMIYRFAVRVRTALNGVEIFSRSIVVAAEESVGTLNATSVASLATENIPEGTTASVIDNGAGVVLSDSSGTSTTIMNQTASGAPSSIVINSVNNTAITQTVKMTLQLATTMESIRASRAAEMIRQQSFMHNLGF